MPFFGLTREGSFHHLKHMPLTDFFRSTAPHGLAGRRPFIKMHGLRNHFVFLDLRDADKRLSSEDVVRICDVEVGIGAEQVITIETPSPGAAAQGAYAKMRILNTDGREAQACGNATRCLALLLSDETGRDDILLETLGGLLACRRRDGSDVSVTLGPISMDWQKIPLSSAADTAHLPLQSGPLRDGMALNIGNPHAVFFVDDFDSIDIPAVAPAIQKHPLFPEGVNVGVAQVVDDRTLRLAVWERPGMLTKACGTGACVASFAGRQRGLLKGDDIRVELPGGPLQIRLIDGNRAIMTGPVEICGFGYV